MANNRLYVGNLPYSVNSDQLKDLFAEYGEIANTTVIIDKRTNRSKGFGFVEFANEEAANQAVEAMNGKEVEGRSLVVNVARPMKPRE
ncbi:MAG: RNA recognition motif domain-containing protein [Patescibacteria group bacterium]|jgi:cold-inducible RNA-binding protein